MAEVEDIQAVIEAAERGNVEEVRRLVQQNRQLLEAVRVGGADAPLTAAARAGRVEVVRYLLDEGADINLRPSGFSTALHRACFYGHVEVVALLLARGAHTGPSNSGWTPLMAASSEGHTDVVGLLLAHSSGDIDQQVPSSGKTALRLACDYYARAGVVEVLLGAGADPHAVDRDGHTPLWEAVRHGHVECVAVLEVSMVYTQVLDGWHQGFNHVMSASHVRSGSAATCSSRPAASATPVPC
jgi:ankyrin repeat protein